MCGRKLRVRFEASGPTWFRVSTRGAIARIVFRESGAIVDVRLV